MKYPLPLILILSLFFSCNSTEELNKNEEDETSEKIKYSSDLSFPEVDSLSHFPNTDFVFTLDQDIPKNKNVIYAPTIVYCWDEIKNHLGGELTVEKQFTLLNLINEFKNFKNVLQKDEYETIVDYDKESGIITAKAYFKKMLPFSTPMFRFPHKKSFLKDSVTYFGFNGSWDECIDFTNILFYNKESFALTINPIDIEHEIILYCPSNSNYKNFDIAYKQLIMSTEDFKNSLTNKNYWKSNFSYEDEVNIPIISFNLETRIKELEGSSFFINESPWNITYAYQRNAFVLNENGAIVESEAEMETEEAEEEEAEEELPQPKLFHFNKPFYIFLKRKDAEYPYFAVLINNSELMIK